MGMRRARMMMSEGVREMSDESFFWDERARLKYIIYATFFSVR
jgi:hypothetical protein